MIYYWSTVYFLHVHNLFTRGVHTMRINHNIVAINTYNNNLTVNNGLQKSFEKVSSGYRINRAADDAAGLGISEGMKAIIRGLEVAENNIQQGISLIQTAESGLGQIINPNLQRMRELAVQASNGTYTSEDRQTMQKEFEQIKQGIDDIANNTEFNTHKVLRPPVEMVPSNPGSGTADIVFVIDNTGSMASIQQTVANNINDFVTAIAGKGVSDFRVGVVEYLDSTIAKSDFSGSKWTNDLQALSDEINRVANTNSGATENTMAAISETADSYDFRENNIGMQNKHIIFVTNESGDDNTLKDDTIAKLSTKGIQVHGIHYSAHTDLEELASKTGGKSIDLSNISWGDELSTVIGDTIGGAAGAIDEEEKMQTLILQVGAAAGQMMWIELFDARTQKLGVDDLQLDPYAEAQNAIIKIDAAIQLASSQRSKFGSYQNALEHIQKSVSNYKVNLANAESQIRDLDISKEILTLTNKKVLLQSSTTMLAQANQLSQSLLQFLE